MRDFIKGLWLHLRGRREQSIRRLVESIGGEAAIIYIARPNGTAAVYICGPAEDLLNCYGNVTTVLVQMGLSPLMLATVGGQGCAQGELGKAGIEPPPESAEEVLQ